MTATESNAAPLSLEMPDTLSTRHIDATIAAALGVTFRFLTRVEKSLPRSYHAKNRTPNTAPATVGREMACHPSDSPDCENCQVWHVCAEIQGHTE